MPKRSGSLSDLRHAADVAAAYDGMAASYDAGVRDDQWMRDVLWRHYARLFREGDRVLDVGCGTGLDAIHLARRGVRVTGIDLSTQMLAQLAARARREGVEARVQPQVADAADLASWPGRYFHGILSAFASLNTVRDLAAFAADAARLLLPRGRLVAHMLAPGDAWEHRKRVRAEGRNAAFRHLYSRHRMKLIAGLPVRHRVISPSEAYGRYFEPYFELRGRYGLGFLLPQETSGRLPAFWSRLFGRAEALLGPYRPFLRRSRFYVLDLESRVESL